MSSFNHYNGDTFDHVADERIRAFLTSNDEPTHDDCVSTYNTLAIMQLRDYDGDVPNEIWEARMDCVVDMCRALDDEHHHLARAYARSFFRI